MPEVAICLTRQEEGSRDTPAAYRGVMTPSLQTVAERLLVLGTALAIYWQPLTNQISLKASDIVFMFAICAWALLLLQKKRFPGLTGSRLRPIFLLLALLGSLLVATVAGYLRYDLTMGHDGIVRLGRLVLCMAIFVAIYHLSDIDTEFAKRISLALLSPIVLLPFVPMPALSATMWEADGRFRGLTVNPNTADLAFGIGLAVAYTLAIYETRRRRLLHVAFFVIVAAGMLMFIVWTQSRAYLAGALASMVLSAMLTASHLRLPKLRTVAITGLAAFIIIPASVLVNPRAPVNSYLTRLSLQTSPAQQAEALANWKGIVPKSERQKPAPPPAREQQPAQPPSGPRGFLDRLGHVRGAVARKLMENPHVQAAVYYSGLLLSNYLGLGVNYEKKFFIVFPWINSEHHGPNSILDVPVYGGVGAVLSLGYLMFLVARRAGERHRTGTDGAVPYAIGTTAALGGLWTASILLGSPIFDYQFWILTAIALI